MAARAVLNQNRDLIVPAGVAKQKKNVAGEGRNRAPLGDIGNVVNVRGAVDAAAAVDGKPITRPITRSFCAQLLANAQAQANDQHKKPVLVNLDKIQKPRQQQKKVVVPKASKPEDVISPDTTDAKKKGKAVVPGSSRKNKVQTLSSVLSARSKFACGVTDKDVAPKEAITDIDEADADDEFAAAEYVEDIYTFYKLVQNEFQPHDYLDAQPEITDKMRAILIDWLIEVHNKFSLTPETLYLTVNIIDRFLSKKTIPRKQLQLVGISAMLIASKYEEIWAPEVNDFVTISDRAYTHEQVLAMEKCILGQLEWTITVPTLYVFLVRFIKASVPDLAMENTVYFLAELGMMHYATVIYCPSMVAASAVYVANSMLNKTPLWNATLQLHTGFSESQLVQCSKFLVDIHKIAGESKLKAVFRKYSKPERGAVSLIQPASDLTPSS